MCTNCSRALNTDRRKTMEKDKGMCLEVVENDFVMFGVDRKDLHAPGGVTMTSPGGVMFGVFTTDNGFRVELLGQAEKSIEPQPVKGEEDGTD